MRLAAAALSALWALTLAAAPVAAQGICGQDLVLQRFETRADPSGQRLQHVAVIANQGSRPWGYTAQRSPVAGVEGATPFGPFIVGPGRESHLPLGTSAVAAPVPQAALRAALTLSCRM